MTGLLVAHKGLERHWSPFHWLQSDRTVEHAMCIESLYKNGLIVAIFGAVFTIVIAIIGWAAMPGIIASVSKKVIAFLKS